MSWKEIKYEKACEAFEDHLANCEECSEEELCDEGEDLSNHMNGYWDAADAAVDAYMEERA